MRFSSQEVNRQAAQWALKLDAGALAPEEQVCLDRWLEADVRNQGALGRAVASLVRVDRLGNAGINPWRAMLGEEKVQPIWTRRRLVMTGSVATGLIAASIAGALILGASSTEEFATKIGETCTANLSDGSTITLNTETKVLVSFSKSERLVQLVRGEAIFHVAKNKKRPFVVTVADARVRAVGTAFSVQRLVARPVQVLVVEGVVEVTRGTISGAVPVRATAGMKAVLARGAIITTQSVSATDVIRDLAWQHGILEFNNTPLSEATREFARYSDTKITLDPAVADRTITGSFSSKDPVAFAKTAAAVLDLQFAFDENEVRISR